MTDAKIANATRYQRLRHHRPLTFRTRANQHRNQSSRLDLAGSIVVTSMHAAAQKNASNARTSVHAMWTQMHLRVRLHIRPPSSMPSAKELMDSKRAFAKKDAMIPPENDALTGAKKSVLTSASATCL